MINDEYPTIQISYEVEAINVYRGNTLTVYLHSMESKNDNLDKPTIQIELRVTSDGEPQIFADDIELFSFSEWQSMENMT